MRVNTCPASLNLAFRRVYGLYSFLSDHSGVLLLNLATLPYPSRAAVRYWAVLAPVSAAAAAKEEKKKVLCSVCPQESPLTLKVSEYDVTN